MDKLKKINIDKSTIIFEIFEELFFFIKDVNDIIIPALFIYHADNIPDYF